MPAKISMKVSEHHNLFLEQLQHLMDGWKFIKSERHFKIIVIATTEIEDFIKT